MQTVWYKSDQGFRTSVMMDDSAMVELGWSDGQEISGDQVWQSIDANARAFCREMDLRRSQNEAVPDTKILAAMCGATTVT